TACKLECSRDGLLEARGDALLDEQAINHNFDGVILAFVDDRKIVEGKEFAVDANANVAILGELIKLLAISALSAVDDGRKDHDPVVGLREVAVQDGLDNLFAGLPSDGLATTRAVRYANRSVNDAEVVVNLGDGTHRRTRGAGGGFLFDGDGGRKTFDHIYFGTLHLIEELTAVGR